MRRVRQLSESNLIRNDAEVEEYGEGPFRTRERIVTVAGNYPSKGKGEYGAWFRDCDGNMLGLGQAF